MVASLLQCSARSCSRPIAPAFTRSVSVKRRPVKHNGLRSPTSGRPVKVRDPLDVSPDAQRYALPNGSVFIVRAPPSVVPPTLPYPVASTSRAAVPTPSTSQSVYTHPLAKSDGATDASLPGLRAPTVLTEHLAPLARAPRSDKKPSAEEIAEMRRLRIEDPVTYTISKLAAQFGISTQMALRYSVDDKDPQGKALARQLREREQMIAEQREYEHGDLRLLRTAERRARRALW